MTLDEIRKIALPACRQFQVKRLDIFGSYTRGEEGPSSDLDLLVEFDEPEHNPAKRFFGLLHHFEDALHCDVDLLTLNGMKNPYFRRRVLNERIALYGGSDSQTSP